MPAFVAIPNPTLQLKNSTSSHSIWRREPIPNVVKEIASAVVSADWEKEGVQKNEIIAMIIALE